MALRCHGAFIPNSSLTYKPFPEILCDAMATAAAHDGGSKFDLVMKISKGNSIAARTKPRDSTAPSARR